MTTLGPIQGLGTVWFIECFDDGFDDALTHRIKTHIADFEAMYSRFKNGSLISKLNQERILNDAPPACIDIFRHALNYYKATEGVFNIAVGEQILARGYDPDYSFTPQNNIPDAPALTEALHIDGNTVTLRAGKLDLGGIGKGVLIDELASLLKSAGHTEVVVNGGGDVFVTHEKQKPVKLTLAHPTNKGEGIGVASLKEQGFAASSPYLRAWPGKDGMTENHLQTTNQVSSYVVAATATEADVWATTLAIAPDTKTPDTVSALLLAGTTILRADSMFELF